MIDGFGLNRKTEREQNDDAQNKLFHDTVRYVTITISPHSGQMARKVMNFPQAKAVLHFKHLRTAKLS
jgi:hypothetical protein